jgi:DNA-directed RNA polymerase subunit H (RpoH/RPB5)
MHELEPKHTKLKPEEVEKLSEDYNISVSQLPKMKLDDSAIPEGCQSGDVVKIERKFGDEIRKYFRVVV